MCCRFINRVLSVQILVIPINTVFLWPVPKVIVHSSYTWNGFPILPVPCPFLPRSSSFTSSVWSLFVCLLFQFCIFFFPRFEPFSLSFRFGVRALCVGLPDTSPTWSALHFWNPLTYVCTLPGYWVTFLWGVENKPYLTVGPNRSLQGFAFVKLWLPQGACETEHTFSVSDTRPTTRKGPVVRHCCKYLP